MSWFLNVQLHYKILHLCRLRPTIHRKNWPHRSHEDSQEVVGDRSLHVVLMGDSITLLANEVDGMTGFSTEL